MKKFFILSLVVSFILGCSSEFSVVKNWKEVISEREFEEKKENVVNVGSTLFNRYIDNVNRYSCFKCEESIVFPEDLTEDAQLPSGFFIPAGQVFCNIFTYDCESDEFYLEIARMMETELVGNDWCRGENVATVREGRFYLGLNVEKEKDSLTIKETPFLAFHQASRGFRIREKKYKLYSKINLIPVIKDSINYNIYFSELIFGGIQNNDLILYFREYYHNEPNQSHSYTFYYNVDDIKRQKKIKFKDMEFEIVGFDNQSIIYKIKK